MKRILLALLVLIAAAVALPPLWFMLSPVSAPALEAPEKFVALASGVRMHVIERGEGPPVVLVHGLPGQASEWRSTTELLAAHGRRVLAIDRIGYGHSDARANDDFTLDANARELRALLAALDLRDVTVVGWSYGGGTALTAAHQEAASAEDARIGRIVLVGSMGPGIERGAPPLPIRLLFSAPVIRWVEAVPPIGAAIQRAMSVGAFSGQPQPEWWLPGLAANLSQPKTFAAFTGEGDFERNSAMPDTTGLALPILILHGDQDRLVPIAVGRTLANNNPNAELVEIAGGSHMLPITHAALLADRIASFSAPPPPAEPVAPLEPEGDSPSASPESWMETLVLR